ncbi:MAG: hypothetical protein U5L09_12995 [Bacteroidales bacterium]|nr:hypothetical protein [Bacteroidales bacterium]
MGISPILTGRKSKQLLGGEDSEICYIFRMAGWKIWYNEKMHLYHYIPSKRLEWRKIVEMHKGFGKAFGVLQIYINLLNRKQPVLNILKENVYFSKYLILKSLGLIKNKQGNTDYLDFIFLKHKFIETLLIRNFIKNYYTVRKLLKTLKQRETGFLK